MNIAATYSDPAAVMNSLAHQGVTPTGMSADSRQIKPGMVFAAYPGSTLDGRKFIAQALAAGAAAVLWERAGFEWAPAWKSVPNVAFDGLKQQVGAIAAQLYGEPSYKLWMIGITGTNGKTSCAHGLAQCLNRLGRKTAVLGTLGNGFFPDLDYSGNTTADAVVIQADLASYWASGAQAVAMEVSSEGLDQGRVNAVRFDVAVLTNLTRDHLDYHGDMARYAGVKARLFAWPGLRHAVLNLDDAFGRSLLRREWGNVAVLGYGFDHGDVRGSDVRLSGDGLRMRVDTPWGAARIETSLLGRFNAYNLLAMLSALLVSDVSLDQAVELLSGVMPPVGRMQTLGGKGQPLVVIDYAHTPDALEQALTTLAEIKGDGKLYCVFGCGGDRDTGKRPVMGEIASRLADRVVVTSDNPRSEDPLDIIAAVRERMSGEEQVEPDRALAIARAVGEAQPDDVVLIAGKGHEDYQEVAGVKHPFRDDSVARRALGARP